MVGRLLYDKGVDEYVTAAKLVRHRYPTVSFELLGPDGGDSPMAYPMENIRNHEKNGTIKYLGMTTDVTSFLCRPDTVVVLPSYYHEGLNRSLMEACGTGCPIITTDIPGCRETVDEGQNGFLVPVKNVEALADAMVRMIRLTRDERQEMGRKGRQKAEREFDVSNVIALYHRIVEDLL